MKRIIKQILKEDRRQIYLDKIIEIMKNDYPILKNFKLYGFWEVLTKDEIEYVLSNLLKRGVRVVDSYYTQIVDEFDNLLYMEVKDGCLKGAFVNYVDNVDNISLFVDNYDCVWNESIDLMEYIEDLIGNSFEPLSLDEFLHEHWSVLNQTMKNDIMFLLNI